MTTPTIIAMGGCSQYRPEALALERYILSHARSSRPRVSFLPTASGDAEGYIDSFQASFSSLACEVDHIGLFRRTIPDLRSHLLSRDVIYVGGGNCWNMLLLWRAHGLDEILREAWLEGVVLCGLSAGSICWFEQGTTDSFGLPLQPLTNGLGFLSGSHCPHYHVEETRRSTYLDWVEDGTLQPGYALDDGAAVRFEGTEPVEFISADPDAGAYRVASGGEGVSELRIDAVPLHE